MLPNDGVIFLEVDPHTVKMKKDFAYFGADMGQALNWDNYIEAYTLAYKELYSSYMKKPPYDTCIDQMIIPLWFLMRHTVELCVKHIEMAVNDKLLDLNHDIKNRWDRIREDVKKICHRQGYDIDTVTIDNYISQINDFDPDSSIMRFSLNVCKETALQHPYRIDVPNMYNLMNEFIDVMKRIYFTIYSRIPTQCIDENIIDRIKTEFYQLPDEKFQILLDALEKKNHKNVYEFLQDIDHNEAVTFVLLFYAGRDVSDGYIYPSPIERHGREDFIIHMASHLDDFEICYDKTDVDRDSLVCGLNNTAAELVIKYLKIATGYFKIG